MATQEEQIYDLFDSCWFQYQIFASNPISKVHEDTNTKKEPDEIVAITAAMSCKHDVEVKVDYPFNNLYMWLYTGCQ
ncbi:hypothetical protein CTI12_AA115540 [Artemisia annua]|uniref:Uncharacterized protein n=1 Tax=Artemisia annua TaxID=35608 RepID=A0A2U1PT52_ARTAN|nr:hypothetical protein CTI12_AA115540 [Artemisia annua]